MRIKLTFITTCIIYLVINSSATVNFKKQGFVLQPKEQAQYTELDRQAEKNIENIRLKQSSIKGYAQELGQHTDNYYKIIYLRKKEELHVITLIKEVTNTIETKRIKQKTYIDTICKKKRGFIGRNIFRQDSCKKWDTIEYKLEDSIDNGTK